MGTVLDLSGQRYGRLNVIVFAGLNKHSQSLWLCRCDCGAEKIIAGNRLKTNNTTSCGCVHREGLIKKNTHSAKHNMTNTRLYHIWSTMKRRCNSVTNNMYYMYGAAGIRVCDEWNDFVPFFSWAISNGYQENLSIDRINNAGDYCPENCRWANAHEQSANRRNANAIIGVSRYSKSKWIAYITIKGKVLKKYFSNFGDAVSQRKFWEDEYSIYHHKEG